MTEQRKCPPLGMGSVDFGALHKADAEGKNLTEALDKARVTPAAPPAKPAKTPARGA